MSELVLVDDTAPAARLEDRPRRHERVVAGNVEMAVTQYDGPGHPLVLINGLGTHQQMWNPLVAGLTTSKVVTFDFPGIGRSHVLGVPQSMSGFASLVERVVDDLGLEQPDLLGYSFGGMVAQEFAHTRPDRVRRLTLVGTAPGVGAVVGYPSAMLALATPMRYYSRTFYKWTQRFLAGGEIERSPEFLQRTAELRKLYRPHPVTYYSQLYACQTWSSLPWLDTVQTPTLVVHGTDDPIIPFANAQLMAQTLPNARLYTASTEGHLFMQDANSRAIPAIHEFVSADDYRKSSSWLEGTPDEATAVRDSIRRSDLRSLQPLGLYNQTVRGLMKPTARR
ncbi:pimeloyl-ACP methyl ester carboxylesterase [Antricoccus suffuscus]|uniref:Pimeloyl-ACP methyl ester carboxylesterase n=1 Tax=Antricoccus suffuscus TaxID=1629062 RepID=A0A2T1A740_9ACTN|nr:alpha/beta hydrolase [Antricoccus suffuscus]PRZ44416.1 pimeloyl-ACP methyl ester carboxylesterase [Antricoccus suffuscus]